MPIEPHERGPTTPALSIYARLTEEAL